MRLVDASRQQSHWSNRKRYRDPRDPAAEAFARPKLEWLVDRLGAGPDPTVLDVGAGNGMFTWWWAQRVSRVEGVELAENMIERSPCGHLLRQGDAYELPFESESFDVVFAGNMLHHLERPTDALREMTRVARFGVGICEGNRNHLPMAAFGVISSACRGVLQYSKRYLRRLAEEAGLEVVGLTAHGFVYENRSPRVSLPVARRLEQVLPGGAYLLMAARTPAAGAGPGSSSKRNW
jgi:SAM-dependent methyltransferase